MSKQLRYEITVDITGDKNTKELVDAKINECCSAIEQLRCKDIEGVSVDDVTDDRYLDD